MHSIEVEWVWCLLLLLSAIRLLDAKVELVVLLHRRLLLLLSIKITEQIRRLLLNRLHRSIAEQIVKVDCCRLLGWLSYPSATKNVELRLHHLCWDSLLRTRVERIKIELFRFLRLLDS